MLQVKPMSSHQLPRRQKDVDEQLTRPRRARRREAPAGPARRSRRTRTRYDRPQWSAAGDPERVPGARARPGPPARRDAVRSRREAERVGHPHVRGRLERARGRVRHAASGTTSAISVSPTLERGRRLRRRRRMTAGDDREVDVPADVEIEAVHQCRKCRRPVKTIARARPRRQRRSPRRRASSRRAGRYAATPGVERELRPVREREERIRRENGTLERVAELPGLPDRDSHRVHAAHLPGADPERLPSRARARSRSTSRA